MPIANVQQPDVLIIDSELRLRRYDNHCEFALSWYQNIDTVYLMDGIKQPYDFEKLRSMYQYLDAHGELYFIEVLEDNHFIPIGDVTFWQSDMPIVIGDERYRKRGIARKVIAKLIERGKQLGYSTLLVNEIYHYNISSQKVFESMGFVAYGKTANGFRYQLDLAEV